MTELPTEPKDYLKEGPDSSEYSGLLQEIIAVGAVIAKNTKRDWDNRAIADTSTIQMMPLKSELGIELRFSRFGKLTTITNEDRLSLEIKNFITTTLKSKGFNYLSESALGKPFRERERMNGDWFHSFFDYV